MKKFIVLGDWISQKPVGMQRFAYQLLVKLDKVIENSDFEVELLIPKNKKWKNSFHNIKVVKLGRVSSKCGTKIWRQICFPLYVIKNRGIGIDLTTELPLFGCQIYVIHDCIPVLFSQNFKNHKFYLYSTKTKLRLVSKKKKKHIITVSNCSAKDIEDIYKVPKEQITVIYNGWEHMNEIQADENIFKHLENIQPQNYYFSLGSKYLHKNFNWILNAAIKNPDNQFVIAGLETYSENWLKDWGVKDIPENVYMTGYLSDGEIKALMLNCKALILPSLYEGFGIPPLEALSLGKKIIVSNVSCLPEIYQDSAYYINPYEEAGDLDKMLEENVGDAQPLLEKYTWKNAAQSFYQLMKAYVK